MHHFARTPGALGEIYDLALEFVDAGGNQDNLLEAWVLYEALENEFGSEFAIASETQNVVGLIAKLTDDPDAEIAEHALIVFNRHALGAA